MAINVEIEKTGNETGVNLLRRFSKRMQGAGIIQKVKGGRYKLRTQSKYKIKVRALNGLEMKKEYERMTKLGKTYKKS
jgi:ribosomal protein S21